MYATMTPTRRLVELKVWMREHGWTVEKLRTELGVGYASAHRYLHGETIPSYRHEALVALGFPPEFLPRILDKTPNRYAPHGVDASHVAS